MDYIEGKIALPVPECIAHFQSSLFRPSVSWLSGQYTDTLRRTGQAGLSNHNVRCQIVLQSSEKYGFKRQRDGSQSSRGDKRRSMVSLLGFL